MSASRSPRLVALDLPPGQAFIDAFDRAWSDGDAVLPLDPRAPVADKSRLVAAMRPHAVIDPTGESTLADPMPLDQGVALVIATSGSTGEPKGAQLTRAALDASAAATAERIDETSDDSWLACLPWQHIGGLQVMLRARRASASLVVHERFTVPDFIDAVSNGVTLTSLVPTLLSRLLDAGVDLSPLRSILLGGAAASPKLLATATLSAAPVVTTYGMSETCGGVVYDGRPLAGVEVRLGPDDRIEISGPTLMAGYRGATESPIVDGWLATSDIGEFAADGTLRVLGRADDVIVTGGEKVVAGRVADLIEALPDVRAAAVLGVDDPEWGQRVVAVVVSDRELNLALIREALGDVLPTWALPRQLVTVSELPLLASGKPDRRALRQLAAGAE